MALLTRSEERIGLAGGIRFEVCLPPSDQRETPFFFPLIPTRALTTNPSLLPFHSSTKHRAVWNAYKHDSGISQIFLINPG